MTKTEGLWTQGLQLHFTPQQLQQLNLYFSDMEFNQDLKHNQTINWIEGEIDKLMQYLCCIVGNLDTRFAAEFLIRVEPTKLFAKSSHCFSYLIRLDSLSVPSQNYYENTTSHFRVEFENDKIPEGFAKIKFEDQISAEKWKDCVTNNGYLRRDKIQKKFIELLEEAARAKSENVQKINANAVSYCSPGKILDAETLHYILSIPPQERIFYGSSEEAKKFDPSDVRKFRIEVIESNYLIRLRIGFLSSNVMLDEDVDVILILGLGLQGWPSNSDYPRRILFTNSDILLHQQMATTGFFLMTAHPPSLVDKHRSTLWQFFFPTFDSMFTNHYSEQSCVNRVVSILYTVMLNLRRTTPGGHTVGKYIIKTLLWFQMERLNEPKFWTCDYLSHHVISILDELVSCLRKQQCRSYFFENYDVIGNSFRNIFVHSQPDDYKEDADLIETFIQRIYALSSSELIGHQIILGERRHHSWSAYESMLMRKWSHVLVSMNHNHKRDDKLIGFVSKQIEYITFLFRAVLITKSVLVSADNRKINTTYSAVNYAKRMLKRRPDYDTISPEDISFIVSVLFDQAKRYYLVDRKSSSKTINRLNALNASTSKMEARYGEGVKTVLTRIRDTSRRSFGSDFKATKFILETLYECTVTSKVLRRILKPYMRAFSIATHENCWYLEEWKNRLCNDEMAALRIFSKLVSQKRIKFKAGLLDALEKGWDWAEEMLKVCTKLKNGQDLLFTLPNGQITRRYLILSDDEIEQLTRHRLNSIKCGYRTAIGELHEILKLDTKSEYYEEEASVYFKLRDGSPMTQAVSSNRRRGMHLGIGDAIFALVTLGKFTTLQEITQVLPEERQHHALETIQKAIKEKQRLERERMKSGGYGMRTKILCDSYRGQPNGFSGTGYDERIHASECSLFAAFDDGQSLSISSSGTGSSLKSDKRYKDRTYVVNDPANPSAYYDAPVTYFLNEDTLHWRNPAAQPYLKLSSDNTLSLSPQPDYIVSLNGDSKSQSVRM